MSTAPENTSNNRSAALTPEQLAIVNQATSAAVQEAVSEVFKQFAPMFKSIAQMPEALKDALTPKKSEEELKKFMREQRESLKSKQDEEEQRAADRARKDACPHLDKNGRSSISLVHNFPDHQPRGVCVLCHDLIHPKEWRIGPADDKNPRGKAYLVAPHKDYKTVMQLENMQ